MSEFLITRRALVKAGLAASVVALVPSIGISGTILASDLQPIGPDADIKSPYKNTVIGELSEIEIKSLSNFSRWAISAWQFEGMASYPAALKNVLNLKTTQLPSYLSEYQNAAQLIKETNNRLKSENETFLYLMFAGRDNNNDSRLSRAQKYVFDEIVMHMVANGGFRKFGFTNYKGYISASFTNPKSYRRGEA